MTTPVQSPSPPPPLGSVGSSLQSNKSKSASHPSWNSFVSDITMSDEEQHRHYNHQNNTANQLPRHYRSPMQHNEDSAASLLEYSQSSEEAYGPNQLESGHPHHRTSSTSFRFLQETKSSRVKQFIEPFSDEDDRSLSGGSSSAQHQAAEEGMEISRPKTHDNGHRHRHHRHHSRHKNQSGGGATVNRETFLTKPNRWVTQLAYSFRTPPEPKQRKRPDLKSVEKSQQSASAHNHHRRNNTEKVDNRTNKNSKQPRHQALKDEIVEPKTLTVPAHDSSASEHSPLLPMKKEDDTSVQSGGFFPKQKYHHISQHGHSKLFAASYRHRHRYDYISMAVAFLQDYEAARPPTLASNVTWITPWHMGLYRLKYSFGYSCILATATMALFLSSCLEGPSPTNSTLRMHTLTALNMFALAVFATDMWIRNQFEIHYQPEQANNNKNNKQSTKYNSLPMHSRTSQANMLMRPLCLFGLFLGLENIGWLLARPDRTFVVLYSSIWKPIALYYISSQARHAMEALMRIARIVSRVLLIEMVLILSFAAVACRLFNDFESFEYLSMSWLSLFKLGTTVVNPSIWMPMYQATHWSAIFFVLFIVVTVFYMHSLVLSVVFQTYIQAATEIHDRSVTDREDAIQLAYAALKKQQQLDARKQHSQRKQQSGGRETISSSLPAPPGGIPMYLVRETLEGLRPHYNVMKINALLEIFDSADAKVVDFPTFRTKIRQALNASVRTARHPSTLAVSIELTAVIVAVINFLYVIMLTSSFSAWWFDAIELKLGAFITVAGLVELVMRTNPMRMPNFTPMTRFNTTFDGLAMLAALISSVGIVLSFSHHQDALEYILMGRAVDMIRVMRFFQIFRDVVRRSSDVLPALLGPIILIATMLHVFVYIGIALWGGAIEVGKLKNITPLYDLNNFNSYMEGLVTMFQVLVVNDWHAIAEVFLYADRCSSPRIVYPFFVFGNLIGVSILVNVVTAFFVNSFVTKLSTSSGTQAETSVAAHQRQDFSIRTSENSNNKRVTSSNNLAQLAGDADDESEAHDADSEGSSDSELFEFDVYERDGYDKIIQTVSGGQHQDDFARQVCRHLELFESLCPSREKIGYLICCQQTMNRYGNRRFEMEAEEFVDKLEFHSLVTEMHAELLVLSAKGSFDDRSLIRTYPHKTDPSKTLEISATILRRHPALSLFVSRIVSAGT